jgi:tyrosine-protein kinase Etk/Wzc
MTTNKEKSIQDSFDLEYLLMTLKKNWYFLLSGVIFGLGVAYLYNKITLPKYDVSSSILIKDYENSFERQSSELFSGFGIFAGAKKFQNELQVLKSRPLIRNAINNLDFQISYFNRTRFNKKELYKNSPFIVVLNQNYPQPVGLEFDVEIMDDNTFRIKAKSDEADLYSFTTGDIIQEIKDFKVDETGYFGNVIKSDHFSFKLILNKNFSFNEFKSNKFSFIINDLDGLAKAYENALKVEKIDIEASVAQISLETTVPAKDIDFINSLTSEYLTKDQEEKIHASVKTIEYIDNQLGSISDSLRRAELNLQKFQTSNRVMDISVKSGRVYNQLQDLEREKGNMVIKYKYYQYINEYFEKNKELSDLIAPSSMGIEDPLLNNLIEELTKLNTERTSLVENNQAKSPYLKQINIKIDNLKNTIAENIKYVINTTDIALRDLNTRINRLNSEINKLPKTERELLGYERKFNLNNTIYTYLLEKRAEAQITKASYMPGAEVIEPAEITGEGPEAPKKNINYILGVLLGFILPFTVLRIRDVLQNKITENTNIEKLTNIPILGQIYTNNKKVNLIVQNFPKSHIAESFRITRTSLNYFIDNNDCSILVITSSFGQEGKSFISINLAASLASIEKRVVILGFDLRKPKVYERLNIKNDVGISSFLINQAGFEDIIQHTNIENLDTITSGPIPPNPSELIASSRTNDLFSFLKNHYDYIIVDTPPVGLLSDTYVLMDKADLNIYVVRQNQTPKREFQSIIKDLKDKNFKNLCLIVNDIPLVKKSKYGYEYYEENKV